MNNPLRGGLPTQPRLPDAKYEQFHIIIIALPYGVFWTFETAVDAGYLLY